MNKLNIKKAITIMERVREDGKLVDMRDWQATPQNGEDYTLFHAVTEYEECGTACCFAGWVALSPEFHEDGGYCLGLFSGCPAINRWLNPDPDAMDGRMETVNGVDAIREWLSIEHDQAAALCGTPYSTQAYPGTNIEDVDADDILKALHSLHDTGKLPGETE